MAPLLLVVLACAMPLGGFAQLDFLLSFNWTCPLPMEEDTNLSDTRAGRQILVLLFDTINSPARLNQTVKALCEDTCSDPESMQCQMCERFVRKGLKQGLVKKCHDWTDAEIRELCQDVPPGMFCGVLPKTEGHKKLDGHNLHDTNVSCVLMEGESDRAHALDCPDGFYCRGAALEPRACRKGFYCPKNTTTPFICPNGTVCPVASISLKCDSNISSMLRGLECMPDKNTSRSIMPVPCPSGKICYNGQSQPCPSGFYCPSGIAAPQKCQDYVEICPAGSKLPMKFPKAFAIAALLLAIISLGTYTIDCWCLPANATWTRFATAVLLVSAVWGSEVWRDNPSYDVAVFVSLLLVLLLWGTQISPRLTGHCVVRGKRPLLAFAIDALFVTGMATGTGWVARDVATFVFLVTFFPGVLVMRVVLVDEATKNIHKVVLMVGTFIAALSGFVWDGKLNTAIVYGAVAVVLALYAGIVQLRERYQARQRSDSSESPASRSTVMSPSGSHGVLVDAEAAMQRPLQEQTSLEDGARRVVSTSFDVESTPAHLRKSQDSSHGEQVAGHISLQERKPKDGSRGDGESSAMDASESRPDGTGISLEFRSVSLLLPNGRKILDNISMSIPAASSVAVMGPSGCGKSSITNVLSDRARYGNVVPDDGILINGGTGHSIRELASITGFVPQDDVMHRNLSVKENVMFQASLRMPITAGRDHGEELEDAVNDVLERLGLGDKDLANTLIGDEDARGVSGGQRKRVSIAMELIAQPRLLFLDEPTSGLDSTTSHQVVGIITESARHSQCTTLTVIHQPRYETLLLFERVIMLAAGGHLVYSGPSKNAKKYFISTLGLRIPENANPADIFMDAITIESADTVMDISKVDRTDKQRFGKSLAKIWYRDGGENPHLHDTDLELQLPELDRETPTWSRQIIVQMQRSMLQLQRDWVDAAVNNVLLVVGLMALVFGSAAKVPSDDLMQPALALFLLMLTQGVAAQRIFGGANRAVGWREAGASVNTAFYFIGRDITALMEIFTGALIFTTIYWSFGPLLVEYHTMLWTIFAYIYVVWGLSYIWSVLLPASGAQMMAVVSAFMAFLFSGVQPVFMSLITAAGDQGAYLMAASPSRWAYGRLMYSHMILKQSSFSNELVLYSASERLSDLGFPLSWISANDWTPSFGGVETTIARWTGNGAGDAPPISFVYSLKQMFLLGTYFRVAALLCLLYTSKMRTRGGGRFIDSGDKDEGHGVTILARGFFKLLFLIFTHLELLILMRTT